MNAKKIIALTLALVMMFAISACGSSETGSTKTAGTASDSASLSTLVCANRNDPGNYGPYGFDSSRFMYQDILFEAMLFCNSDGELEKVLLEDYESLGDGVYRLYLYDYIHDTQGNALTASDIVFSFEKAIENGTYSSILSCFDGFDIIDDYTLDMKLVDEKAGSFAAICCAIKIVTEAAWEASGDEMVHNGVGTSPYQLTDYEEGSYVTYEKTNNYWQTDESLVATSALANADIVKWVMVEDNSACAIALQTGEVDFIKAANFSDYSLFMDENMNAIEDYCVAALESQMTYGIAFNCGENSLCSDINLRKAICYAIDTEAIAANIFGSYATAAANYINPAYADYDASLEDLDSYYRYDAELAADYLSESAYENETFTILSSSTGSSKDISTLVQGYLLALGIQCEVETYESALFSNYYYDENAQWDIVITGSQGGTGTEYMWSVLYACDNTINDWGNLLHIDDSTLQELYETMADVNTNSTETLGAFLDYVNENCYVYDIMNFYKFSFGGSHIQELVVNNLGEIVPGACVLAE